MLFRKFIGLAFALVVLGGPANSIFATDPLQAFVGKYCVACHGADTQEGDRQFDRVALSASNENEWVELRDILDQLILGEMPPADELQPSSEEKKRVIKEITQVLDAFEVTHSTADDVTLRRLNRREYLNTIRDLFGFRMEMFDPTTKFPRDQAYQNFDNIGDALVTSNFLLQQYLDAADAVIEKAARHRELAPERTWEFSGPFRQQPEVDKAHALAFDNRYMCLYECMQSEQPEGAFGPLLAFPQGVHSDGMYEVKVLVEAKNRVNPYSREILKLDPDEPLRLGIVSGSAKLDRMHVAQAFHEPMVEVELSDDGPHWLTFEVPLDQGFSPRFVFPNGLLSLRSTYSKLVREHNDLLPEKFRRASGIVQNRIAIFSAGYLPHIRVHEVKIRGPLATSPVSTSRKLLGSLDVSAANVRPSLKAFADRAYRRPATDDEIDHLVSIYRSRSEQGVEPKEALDDAMKGALCAPGFVYIDPIPADKSDRVRWSYALASRLSYFLWSSMPDDELLELAASTEILKPDVLRVQTRRMIADSRSQAFVAGFLDSWLNLRSLGDMPPAREEFAHYYTRDLETAMRRETELFFHDVLQNNSSVSVFLDSQHSFLNRNLAKLYGVEEKVSPVGGSAFRRVAFEDKRRGGLLGQASVLTVTANGIETSPVRRGVWLLENVLGTPPSPPPEDVPAIDPDVRGAKSIRDLLVKHRESAACAECHRKIDPLGFALENFDAIGQWRRTYKKSLPIDSSGKLPSGEAFDDIGQLKAILLERRSYFARMLTEKLVCYAVGRTPSKRDRPAIEKIVKPLEQDDYPLRTLVEAIVTSPLFIEQ